jgi:hypothetical protein
MQERGKEGMEERGKEGMEGKREGRKTNQKKRCKNARQN